MERIITVKKAKNASIFLPNSTKCTNLYSKAASLHSEHVRQGWGKHPDSQTAGKHVDEKKISNLITYKTIAGMWNALLGIPKKMCTERRTGSKIRLVKNCIGLTLVENEMRQEHERLLVGCIVGRAVYVAKEGE